jgi:hypothetical protein
VGGVEDEFADEVAGVAVDDADVEVVDEQGDRGAGEPDAEADVVEPAVVAQGDAAAGVDLVVPDAVVGVDEGAGRDGFGSGLPSLQWGAAVQGAVRPGGVVVLGKGVELGLQVGDGGGRGLGGDTSSGSGGGAPPCRRSRGGRAGRG